MSEVEEIFYSCFLTVLFSFLLYPVFQEVKHDTVVKKDNKKIEEELKKEELAKQKKYYRQKTKASKNVIQYNFAILTD